MSDGLAVVLPAGPPPSLGLLPPGLRRRLLARLAEIDEQERAEAGEAPPPAPEPLLRPAYADYPVIDRPLLLARAPAAVAFSRQGRGFTVTFERRSA